MITSLLLPQGTCWMSFVIVKGAWDIFQDSITCQQAPWPSASHSRPITACPWCQHLPGRLVSRWSQIIPREAWSQSPVHRMGSLKVTFTGIAVFLSFMFYVYLFMWHLFFCLFSFGGGMWDLVPCQGLNPGPLCWERGGLAAGPRGGPRDGFQRVFALWTWMGSRAV